jgi:PepSY-associated TM region
MDERATVFAGQIAGLLCRYVKYTSFRMASMLKAYALRFHRWITLLFALPLLVVIGTGLILSFEPLAQQSRLEKPLTKADLLGYLQEHDPQGKATGLSLRTYENSLTIAGAGEDGEVEIDLGTGEVMEDGGFAWSDIIRTSRGLHQTLLIDMEWLVIASTLAMLVLAALGLLMGLPKLRNTVGGWHNLAAWITLPLVIISPLTGLAIAYGITFTTPTSGGRPERVSIAKAVEIIADKHDLANMTSLRARGGRLIARVFVDGSLTNLVVTPAGLQETQRNWPRAIHEGNWSGFLAPVLNIIVSIVFVGLLFTGLFIWVTRTLRMRRRKGEKVMELQAAE